MRMRILLVTIFAVMAIAGYCRAEGEASEDNRKAVKRASGHAESKKEALRAKVADMREKRTKEIKMKEIKMKEMQFKQPSFKEPKFNSKLDGMSLSTNMKFSSSSSHLQAPSAPVQDMQRLMKHNLMRGAYQSAQEKR